MIKSAVAGVKRVGKLSDLRQTLVGDAGRKIKCNLNKLMGMFRSLSCRFVNFRLTFVRKGAFALFYDPLEMNQ